MAKVQQSQGQLMKNLYHYLTTIEESKTGPQEGQSVDFVLNEEYSIRTDIVAVDGRDVYVGLDHHAYELLERAGVIEAPIPAARPNQINLAQSNQTMTGAARPGVPAAAPAATGAASLRAAQNRAASGTTGTATATPAAAAAAPAPSGARNPTAGAKPAPKSASTTNANVKAANAAFVKNQQNAAVDQANATRAAQTAAVSAANQPAAATDSGATGATAMASKSTTPTTPAAATDSGATGATAMASKSAAPATFGGIQPQANIPGSPTDTTPATTPSTGTSASAPATFGGIQPQANIPGSPTAAGSPASAPATPPGLAAATTPQGQAVGGDTVPTRGGPAVTGGFGQETNINQDSDAAIAARGPMGTTKPMSEEDDFEKSDDDKVFERVMQLAGVKRG